MLQALWMVSLREWRVHRLRVTLTTMGIALGVAVFFAVRTANASLLNSLQETVEKMAGKATLEVTAGKQVSPRASWILSVRRRESRLRSPSSK